MEPERPRLNSLRRFGFETAFAGSQVTKQSAFPLKTSKPTGVARSGWDGFAGDVNELLMNKNKNRKKICFSTPVFFFHSLISLVQMTVVALKV